MKSNENDASAVLSEQYQRQVRLARVWMTGWIPWIFIVGLCFSALGLTTSLVWFREEGSPTLRVVILAFLVVYFAWAVVSWLTWPFWLRPRRIVPYFTRQLEEYGGKTSNAFVRGRGLCRELVALERLAGTRGVRPLSAFGFADDYYEQEVTWHRASDGLRTVEALRQDLGEHLLTADDVAQDLEALASGLRVAADQGVDFCLVLRLHKKDSLQVASMERRQGKFW